MTRLRKWTLLALTLALGVVLVACGGNGGGTTTTTTDGSLGADFVGVWELTTYDNGDVQMSADDVAARQAEGYNIFLVIREDGTGEWNDSGQDVYGFTWEATSATEATGTWDDTSDTATPAFTLADGVLTVVDGAATSTFAKSSQDALDSYLATATSASDTSSTSTATVDSLTELTDHFASDAYGFAFDAPAGSTARSTDDPGQIALTWSDPFLYVYAYVQDEDQTVEDCATMMQEQYGATIVSQTEDTVIAQSTDSDGDTNYTKIITRNGRLYYLDIYFHPEDSSLKPAAFAMLDSFTVE